ncbi:MAG: transglutaminase-like cysteine peptidase [Bacteroidota bacterium]|nr:transglutaminase-like cysteine peptidase [Kiloniellaceae bacterium]
MLSRRTLLCTLGGCAASAALPAAARAAAGAAQGPLPHSSAMAAGDFVPAPAAWLNLLRQLPDLDPGDVAFRPLRLTGGRAARLLKVNQEVNAALRYRDDAGKDYWEVGGQEGDCEDFAIRKLRDLTQRHGFPRGALTLAACRLDYDRGHAVLLVHSDKGVYVMDNLTPRVLPWRKLPYRWVAREEPGAPFRLWRALG